jgi:hypothetical protein
MVVVKDEDLFVRRIAFSADAGVAGTEITVRHIVRKRCALIGYFFAAPWPVLSMGGNNDPFLS